MIPEEADIPTLYDFNHSPLVFFKDIYINLGHIYFYDRRHPILKGKK